MITIRSVDEVDAVYESACRFFYFCRSARSVFIFVAGMTCAVSAVMTDDARAQEDRTRKETTDVNVDMVVSTGTGLEVGDKLETLMLDGDVSVMCRELGGRTSIGYVSCRRWILEPAESSRFKTDKNTGADRVILKATHEDGRVITKDGDFDSANGVSKGRFNLWINTLFQRALLDEGRNEIEYVLKSGDAIVRQGKFTVTVGRGQNRACPLGHATSNDPNDCRFGGSAVCNGYFHDMNYCR